PGGRRRHPPRRHAQGDRCGPPRPPVRHRYGGAGRGRLLLRPRASRLAEVPRRQGGRDLHRHPARPVLAGGPHLLRGMAHGGRPHPLLVAVGAGGVGAVAAVGGTVRPVAADGGVRLPRRHRRHHPPCQHRQADPRRGGEDPPRTEGTGRVRLTDDERRDWLRLYWSENIGPTSFRMLLGRYGDATTAIEALPELSRRGGMTRSIRVCAIDDAERWLARADALGARFIAAGEDGYPPLLRHVESAPPLLCVKGSTELTQAPALAVVGARNASAAGRRFTRQIVGDIAAAGYVIVSGLARGIDTAAHEASLETGTIAVIAGGIDVVYPPE